MKTLIWFFIVFSLIFPSFGISRLTRGGGAQKTLIDAPKSTNQKTLQDNLTNSGLAGSWGPGGDKSMIPAIAKELAKYCPNSINSLSTNI